jgi:hypothetical protein
MKNTLLYTLILVVVVMLVVDVVVMFMGKRPYQVVHYDARYEYDFTDTATFTTTTRVIFKKENYLDDYITSLKENATNVIQKYFDDLGEKLKRKLTVLSYSYAPKKVDPLTLEIKETLVLKGAVQVKRENDEKLYEASLGDIKINAVGNSSVEVVLPENSEIISVEPQPTENLTKDNEKVLMWKGESLRNFPKVVYKEKR